MWGIKKIVIKRKKIEWKEKEKKMIYKLVVERIVKMNFIELRGKMIRNKDIIYV